VRNVYPNILIIIIWLLSHFARYVFHMVKNYIETSYELSYLFYANCKHNHLVLLLRSGWTMLD